MPTGDPGDPRSATPTDQPGQTHDAGTNQPDTAAPVPPVSTPAQPSEPSTATPAASGAPAPAKTDATPAPDDPVKAAIARLARDPSVQPRDEQGRFTVAEQIAADAAKAAAKAAGKPAAAAPAKPATTAPAAKPATTTAAAPGPGVDTDPYHGFDERERAALKGRTQERIEDLHRRWRAAETARLELEKAGPPADEFAQLVKEHKLEDDAGFVQPENLAVLVKAEAAVMRSMMALQQNRRPIPTDIQFVGKFFEEMDAVRAQLGLAPRPAAPAEIRPFAGELPQEAKDLVEVYGLPEADVRLLVALKARKAAAGVVPGGQPAGSAAAPPAQQPPAPPAQPRGVGPDMNQLYGQKLISDLTRGGVQPAMVHAHLKMLMPIAAKLTQARFPGLAAEDVAGVFDALPPKDRYDIMVEAHRNRQASMTPPAVPARTTPPPPATPPSVNGTLPRRPAPSPSGDPVVDAVSFLARPG